MHTVLKRFPYVLPFVATSAIVALNILSLPLLPEYHPGFLFATKQGTHARSMQSSISVKINSGALLCQRICNVFISQEMVHLQVVVMNASHHGCLFRNSSALTAFTAERGSDSLKAPLLAKTHEVRLSVSRPNADDEQPILITSTPLIFACGMQINGNA